MLQAWTQKLEIFLVGESEEMSKENTNNYTHLLKKDCFLNSTSLFTPHNSNAMKAR